MKTGSHDLPKQCNYRREYSTHGKTQCDVYTGPLMQRKERRYVCLSRKRSSEGPTELPVRKDTSKVCRQVSPAHRGEIPIFV
jgi:hypothetical protein